MFKAVSSDKKLIKQIRPKVPHTAVTSIARAHTRSYIYIIAIHLFEKLENFSCTAKDTTGNEISSSTC